MKIPLSRLKMPYSVRGYAHFDHRVSLASCYDLVSDPQWVARHSFYPFIGKEVRRIKWREGVPHKDPRPIRYAAHLDRCIYQYYTALLNDLYNIRAYNAGIDGVSIAYRTNHPGMSNCNYACEAFSYIREQRECWVAVGDFKSFFETLDHGYLKRMMRSLFDDNKIPDDYYRILKSATKYAVWPIDDLLARHKLPVTRKGIQKLNKKAVVLSREEFKSTVKECVTHPWKESGLGIAQGLPVSGVLANIYMLEFDAKIEEIAKNVSGLYMRYSDDFIVAAPTAEGYRKLMNGIKQSGVPGVMLHPEKTFGYCVEDGIVTRIDSCLRPMRAASHGSQIDYLGFCFDGGVVRMRQSTVGRYYRRSYRKVRRAFGGGERPSRKRVRRLYVAISDWGRSTSLLHNPNGRRGGNFLTYAHRAAKIFESDPILNDVRRHKRKIRARSRRDFQNGVKRTGNSDC